MVVIIDLHCHILPGVDDGARDWEDSLEMARFLVSQGVTGVVATPHWLEDYFTPKADEILDLVNQFERKLNLEGINLKVFPGSEIHISPELPELVRQGKVLTINNGGKYLLVEFPFKDIPIYTDTILNGLMGLGITPIIAHPERNERFACDTNKLISYINLKSESKL